MLLCRKPKGEISGAYPYNKTTPKLGNLKSPSLKIAFSDALYLRSTNKEGAYWGWWGIYSTISGNTVTEGFDIMHDIHFKSANILFLDGHCGQQKDAVDTLQNGQSDVISRHWDPTKSK